MATMSIQFPDAISPRVLNAFALRYGYESNILDAQDVVIANPETKAQFAKRMVMSYIRETVRLAEVDSAVVSTTRTTEAAVRSEIVLT